MNSDAKHATVQVIDARGKSVRNAGFLRDAASELAAGASAGKFWVLTNRESDLRKTLERHADMPELARLKRAIDDGRALLVTVSQVSRKQDGVLLEDGRLHASRLVSALSGDAAPSKRKLEIVTNDPYAWNSDDHDKLLQFVLWVADDTVFKVSPRNLDELMELQGELDSDE